MKFRALTACLIALVSTSCVMFRTGATAAVVVPDGGYQTLDRFPFKEAWYGMYFHEDKVGFSRFRIDPEGENFVISSESQMRLTAMKRTNEIRMKEKITVRPDLTLVSFDSRTKMNDRDLKMTGAAQGDTFRLDITVDGEQTKQDYAIDGKLYHTSAVSLMPALKGIKDGRKYSFDVFNPEKQGVERIEQTVHAVKGDPGPHGAVWKVDNTYGRSVVQSWLDTQGRTVLEKALEGALISVIEDESTAKQFQEKKQSSGKDLILDYSLIKTAKAIPEPEKQRFLKVRISGVDASLIAEDHRQKKSPDPENKDAFILTVNVETVHKRRKPETESIIDRIGDEGLKQYLVSSAFIQSGHPEIKDQSVKIVGKAPPLETVNRLVRWTAKNIADKMQDSFSALAVLRSKEGECQSHANLFTAFARAQNVPTRVITGLVYSEKVGFLYHAWAESYVNGWLAVDPTFNQIPADATHIKISADGAGEDQPSLFKLVGKIKIDVLEFD